MTSRLAKGQYWYQRNKRVREVNIMAASIVVEEDSGVFSGFVPSHNGYYAGDFAAPRSSVPARWTQAVSSSSFSARTAA
jgi:hypothetical protein